MDKDDHPHIPILTPCDHHVVGDGDESVHTVRVAGELVRVKAVLVLAKHRNYYSFQ